MAIQTIADRISLENQILSHVRQALVIAVDAPIVPETSANWLERFCFLADSFCRHVRRLFKIKREGGYMEFVIDCQKPTLGGQADRLCAEQARLTESLESIVADAHYNCASHRNLANLHGLRQRVQGFLACLDEHLRCEQDLCMAAFMDDVGGEG